MNRTLSHLDALLEKRNFSGGDRLASLNRSIDSIERKLGSIGNSPAGSAPAWQQNTTTPGNNSKFEELERKVRELTNGMAQQGVAPHNAQPGVSAGSSAGRSGWNNNQASNDPLAEIAERKRHLNNSTQMPAQLHSQPHAQAHAQPHESQTFQPSASADIHELGKRIDELRTELAGELNGIHKSVAKSSETASSSDDLDRIARGIRELQEAPRYDPTAFDTLHRELDDLRLSLSSSVRHEDFNNGINDLNVRLEQISSGMNSADSDELNEIKSRLDLIGANTAGDNTAILMSRIDALGQLVENQTGANAVEKIEDRLQSLVEAVNSLSNNQQPAEPTTLGLDTIEARLDEITRAIVAVSVTDQNQPTADNEAIVRLEGQLAALAQGIEAVVRKNDDEQFAQLSSRMEGLAGSLEMMSTNMQNVGANTSPDTGFSVEIENQLKELASRLDMDAVEKHRDEDQLTQIASRIEGLTEKFGSFTLAVENNETGVATPVTVVQDTTQIESQLQQLADRLDSAIGASSSDLQLQNLETQIADIAERLGATDPVTVDLGAVETRLGMIEQNLGADRDLTLEAATQAAQSAVEMMGDQGFSGELINALAEDLRALQTAANHADSKTMDSLNSVHSALNTLVERLGSIENQLGNNGASNPSIAAGVGNHAEDFAKANQEVNVVSQHPMAGVVMAESSAKISAGETLLEKIDQAPSIDPTEMLQPDAASVVEDNRPLEPGSGAPDIPALVKRASEKYAGGHGSIDPTTEKTDFVAAARRAAQAAVSEVTAVKEEALEKPKSSSLLSKLPSVPRKPIIIAAAAVLMAVIAFAGSKIVFGSNGETAIVAVNPAPIEAPVVSSVEAPVTGEATASAPTANVRAAVPYAASEDEGGMPATAYANNAGKPASESGDAANAANSFNTGISPKQTDQFSTSAKPESAPEMAMTTPATAPAMAGETTSRQPETSASSEKITSAPLPPARLGSVTLRQAAATGDVRAQHEVALRYTNGSGVKRDLSEAAIWYERAAAREFAPAQYRLGSLYEKGLGVKRDLTTAMSWYSRAAEQGNARAMHNLAVISAMGASGKPDMGKALTWFTKAANFGVKDSQFNLGILHGQGMGVKQDLAESYKWFALAAKSGDNDATRKRDEVANVMDPKALEKSRIIVRDWRPEKLRASANRVVIPEEWRGKAKVQNASTGVKETIKQTQAMLNKLGYKVGTPDGVMGPKTRGAIVRFQNKAGLSPTGTINTDLVKALKGLSI